MRPGCRGPCQRFACQRLSLFPGGLLCWLGCGSAGAAVWGSAGRTGGGGGAGEYLESSADSTCTWLSSDGGQSWVDVLPTAAIYEVRTPVAAAACAAPHALAVAPAAAGRTWSR